MLRVEASRRSAVLQCCSRRVAPSVGQAPKATCFRVLALGRHSWTCRFTLGKVEKKKERVFGWNCLFSFLEREIINVVKGKVFVCVFGFRFGIGV